MPSPHPDQVVFRPLATSDIPDMVRWLGDPDVARWWPEDDLSLNALIGKYAPIISGDEPVRGFIIEIEGAKAGFIQAYRVDDHPDYARQLDVPADAVATDLFIGEPAWRGKGWGAIVLQAFLRQVVFALYDTNLAIIAPTPANTRAIRTYERCGFRWLETVAVVDEEHPLESGDEYVMILSRDDFNAAGAA